MGFTSTQAYEASEEGEPIMITVQRADHLLDAHEPLDDRAEFWEKHQGVTHVDAWDVFLWLGY